MFEKCKLAMDIKKQTYAAWDKLPAGRCQIVSRNGYLAFEAVEYRTIRIVFAYFEPV